MSVFLSNNELLNLESELVLNIIELTIERESDRDYIVFRCFIGDFDNCKKFQ